MDMVQIVGIFLQFVTKGLDDFNLSFSPLKLMIEHKWKWSNIPTV